MSLPTVTTIPALDIQLLSESAKRDLVARLKNVRTGAEALNLRDQGLSVADLDLQGRVKLISDPNTGVEIGVVFKRGYKQTPVFADVAPSMRMRDESDAWIFINLLEDRDAEVRVLQDKITESEVQYLRMLSTSRAAETLAEQQEKIIETLETRIKELETTTKTADLEEPLASLVTDLQAAITSLTDDRSAMSVQKLLASLGGLKKKTRDAFVTMHRTEVRLSKAQKQVFKKTGKRTSTKKFAEMMAAATAKAKAPKVSKKKATPKKKVAVKKTKVATKKRK